MICLSVVPKCSLVRSWTGPIVTCTAESCRVLERDAHIVNARCNVPLTLAVAQPFIFNIRLQTPVSPGHGKVVLFIAPGLPGLGFIVMVSRHAQRPRGLPLHDE